MNEKQSIQVEITHSGFLNYTFCLNKLNFLKEITITHIEEPLENFKLEIISSSGVFEKYSMFFDEISSGKFTLTDFDFEFNTKLLRNLTEKDLDTIKVTLSSNGVDLFSKSFSIDVLPIDSFGGLQNYPQLLATYIIPNHPVVYEIKAAAIKILEKRNMSPAFEGYQSGNKERVLQIISALYKTIQQKELIYSSMPPSFEKTGQRIRLIDQVLKTKFGNCIDISLLFAALLESVDLNPIIIITRGHAFVGVWLEDQRFDTMINFDQAALSKRIAKGIREIAIIEMTTLCKGQLISFSDAISTAEVQIMNEQDFLLSIDIKSARSYGVFPLPVIKEADFINKNEESDIQSIDEEEDYDLGETYNDLELTELSNLTKIKVWERKLLDLSLRNNLLNLRFTKSMLQLIDLEINLLEDNLADGKTYTIMPDNNQAIIRKYNNYTPPLHPSTPLFKFADDEFKYNRLLTTYHTDDLERILTHLYRNSRLAEEENGKSTLYLGLGLLKWFDPKNQNIPRLAPILLIPVELSRRSVKSKFTLKSREEETMINITLVEYLKQEFRLNLDALEHLPMDDLGVDVPKVLAIIRNAVLNLEGWDVLEQIVLGTFSFSKLLLWQDLSKYSEEIQKNPIVRSLIDGKLSDGIENLQEEDYELENLASSKLKLPIPADNSQTNAVMSANMGKTFILHGPPGTGKSQTITNIIADALSNGKKVLFVAAKKAALEVVQSRLDSIGLGPFCLELHSNKSKKSDVLKQFEASLEIPKYQLNSDFSRKAERLDSRKTELNKYVTFLHQKNKIGWSLYQSISFLEQFAVSFDEQLQIPLDFENLEVTKWNSWNDWLIPYSAVVKKTGFPKQHPLRFIKVSTHQVDTKNRITQAIDNYLKHYKNYLQLSHQIELKLTHLNEFLNVFIAIQADRPKEQLLNFIADDFQKKRLREWIDFENKKEALESEIQSKFNKNIFNLDFQSLEQNWNQAKFSWFLPKWLQQRKIKKILQGYSTNKVENEQQIDLLFSQLADRNELKTQLSNPEFRVFDEVKGMYSTGGLLNSETLKNDIEHIENIVQLAGKTGIENVHNWLLKASSINLDEKVVGNLRKFVESKNELASYVFSIPTIEDLENIKNNLEHLDDWINYQFYKNQASELDLNWFTTLVEKGAANVDNIEHEFYKTLHFNHFLERVYAHEELKTFDASIYKSLIKQYRELHKEFTEISRNQLIATLSANIPNLNVEAAQSSEVGILLRAIRSRGRGVSIRRLFDQIPNLIPRLKPCMLMSPISVAQYFDVDDTHFDLVIFDEASQLPTSEAISALARAKQAIIVGDPKQMPPTSFFTSSKVDEENFEMEDLESILEDCLALSIPSNYLLRHYRSKHESLITFSNKNFYDSKLLTFPSPDDLNQKVSFEFVEGFYDKGKTRTNQNEARAVIKYIQNHLALKNRKSLGVVTFNQSQQNLIEDLLQKLFLDHPDLESFALESEEPIFIKNLENVQGDERDIILFSIGYGPDKEGNLSMNFGPLNRDGGWRRLNVAVTRARYEMKVFSSLRADQINLSRTKSEGVKGLKDFLNFSEKGSYTIGIQSNESQRISLIDAIADYLQDNGLNVKKHIGTSEYKVDLGIVHPENEKEYILGILVDGDSYFNIHTTNDRELLAPNVLQALGWNIFRIWTLDWIKNKEAILEKIKTAIDKNLKSDEEAPTDITPLSEETDNAQNDFLIAIDDSKSVLMIPYESAVVDSVPSATSESIYFLENRSVILDQMREIIRVEAPISKNLLFRKILKLWNTSRAGSKLNTHLSQILLSLPEVSITQSHQDFIWSDSVTSENLIYYRENTTENRSIDDISAEELSVAILEIMNNNLSMEKSDLIRMCSRAFGFMKVGSQIDQVISQTINNLIAHQKLALNADRIALE